MPTLHECIGVLCSKIRGELESLPGCWSAYGVAVAVAVVAPLMKSQLISVFLDSVMRIAPFTCWSFLLV